MRVSPLAGHPPPPEMLLDVSKLVTAYYTGIPDPSVPAQCVAFGTSGHRGSAFEMTFNELHVLAISEAICRYRRRRPRAARGVAGCTSDMAAPICGNPIHNRSVAEEI